MNGEPPRDPQRRQPPPSARRPEPPPPRDANWPEPPEATSVIRRDRRAAPPDPRSARPAPPDPRSARPAPPDPRAGRPDEQPRAWSQAPPPPPQQRRPGGPPPQQPPPPADPNGAWLGGVQHAPRQQPRPYADRQPAPATHRPPPRRAAPPRGPQPPAPPPRDTERPKPRRPKFRIGRIIAALVLVLVLASVAGFIYLDRSLNRVDALADYSGRVADTPGTNWLIVGSDSRVGLTPEQEQSLATGGDVGSARTDTILVVHIPKSGASTLVSIPRDSYVPIPGYGRDKINAAFAFGGPQLLVQTVEGATGLRMDHYAEIGFGGFAGVVDAIGGIRMCLDEPMSDPLAGIDLPAGCQDLSGAQALGFVRSRATALADLQRANNQRMFMSALAAKAASPATLLNPLRAWPLATRTANSPTVDDGDHLWNLGMLAWAMRGDLVTTTVPISGFEDTDGSGNVVLWDSDRAGEFFGALAADKPIPAELVTAGP
ncbi:LCP family protein [Aldersonia sp. NBC_00410]|uniref:LCP family protein n=1 Tax=Aldersonia sp. NBC_00410 TaxID=2975954 RepID=UPI00225B5A97|nr:LCP family protein [Aldersonia sp. NBC_00410]MCX5045133.1 LCP family protein [Aldersonia sp. NBC_00410]